MATWATQPHGSLEFDYGDARPRVQGQLRPAHAGTRPLHEGKPKRRFARAKSGRNISANWAGNFDLRALNNTDVDLTWRVGKWP